MLAGWEGPRNAAGGALVGRRSLHRAVGLGLGLPQSSTERGAARARKSRGVGSRCEPGPHTTLTRANSDLAA